MLIEPLKLSGAFRIRLVPQADERGYFVRTFCKDVFERHGLETNFVQHSVSFNHRAGTLRGLHFQAAPHAETKIVRCSRGAAYDVIVDMRSDSPTYRNWHGEEISADNQISLYIPKGFAHGFQTLVDESELQYQITPAFVPDAARGIKFDDADLNISWPMRAVIVSQRDRDLPKLRDVGSI